MDLDYSTLHLEAEGAPVYRSWMGRVVAGYCALVLIAAVLLAIVAIASHQGEARTGATIERYAAGYPYG
jgi:hypothetical protein